MEGSVRPPCTCEGIGVGTSEKVGDSIGSGTIQDNGGYFEMPPRRYKIVLSGVGDGGNFRVFDAGGQNYRGHYYFIYPNFFTSTDRANQFKSVCGGKGQLKLLTPLKKVGRPWARLLSLPVPTPVCEGYGAVRVCGRPQC